MDSPSRRVPQRSASLDDAWMWDERLSGVVERDGQKWLRVRPFEKDADMRAWAKIPSNYEFHEGDDVYLALLAQLSAWKRIAPILKAEWPDTLTDLPARAYPEAAKRFASLMRRQGAEWEVQIMMRSRDPNRPDSKHEQRRSRPKKQET